ncbi:RDD family protein [Paludifilum halophilum]|uniref:RDD domain-containing protein n=1 Tax=Paludifilum halophilum TaxID=1642702 RepID=A0A235BBB5_9BACL|nr:RDD family protein [Paludifilum halophilum]OYD09581.1 hypothetical protein CHM34_00775 [Paludifilum halophilum]
MENRISVTTPEFVNLEFETAGVGSRALALLLDWLILSTAGLLLLIPASLFMGLSEIVGNPFWSSLIIAVFFFLFLFLPLAYYVLTEYFMNGQTIGKKVMGLRVISDQGTAPGFLAVFLRNLLRMVDNLPLLYLVGMTAVMIHSREKRLGDLAAGTLVVSLRGQPMPQIRFLYANGEPLFASRELSPVTEQQWMTLDRYLHRREWMTPAARQTLAAKLVIVLFPDMKIEPGKEEFYLETAYIQLGPYQEHPYFMQL